MEFMAALRGTFDDQKPSLFELLSEQQLHALLPPTLRYLLTVATQRHPRYLLRILNSFDELYALAMLAVERHYLLTRGGSFTEHFYGLRRERALPADVPRAALAAPAAVRSALALGSADVWRNLAVLVALPYLRRKLDDAHARHAPRALLGQAYTRLPPDASVRQRAEHYYRWFLSRVYPSAHAALGLAVLAWNLAYLFDNSRFHSPLLWLVGTRIRRMTAADYRAIEALGAAAAAGGPPGPRSFFSPRAAGSKLLSGLSVLLPTSIFALKFLEWWHASDFAKQLSRRAAETLDLPPPVVPGLPGELKGILKKEVPGGGGEAKHDATTAAAAGKSADPLAENAPVARQSLLPIYTVPAPAGSELCPICEDEVQTATACQTGVVYCYTCIHRWVAGEHQKQESFMADKMGRWESGIGRCAVTGRRVLGGTEGLRRIMV